MKTFSLITFIILMAAWCAMMFTASRNKNHEACKPEDGE